MIRRRFDTSPECPIARAHAHGQRSQRGKPGSQGAPEVARHGLAGYPLRPLALASSEDQPASAEVALAGPTGVLVVEDDPLVRNIVACVLSDAGYAVFIASNAEEGLIAWREHRADIGVVLTDVNMPCMSGPEMAARLVDENASVPIVFMSGGNVSTTISQGERFLPKPFTSEQLEGKIRWAIKAGADAGSRSGALERMRCA